MPASEKAVVGREGARMRRLKDEMSRISDQLAFCTRRRAPKQENDRLLALVEDRDDAVGKDLPSPSLMALRSPLTDGQGGVEEQNPLLCPGREITRLWGRHTDITLQLLVDVAKRRGRGYSLADRKAEPVRLTRAVVGVLAEDDRLDALARSELQSAEDIEHRGIDAPRSVFLLQKLPKLKIVRSFKFAPEQSVPIIFKCDHPKRPPKKVFSLL